MMQSINQLKSSERERERERERRERERKREKEKGGETERDFCTIDLHPIDKLENASRQSEKNEEIMKRKACTQNTCEDMQMYSSF